MPSPGPRSPRRQHDRQYFYKYVSAETAKKILATCKLRWSSPVLFNDPFDVTQELRLNFGAEELTAAVVEEIADLIVRGDPIHETVLPELKALFALFDGASASERSQLAERFRTNPPATTSQEAALDELRKRWSEIVLDLRVLCMSEAPDVTSMWQHYADEYRGVVLQFEASDELDSVWLIARPVAYQDAPPPIADARTWARCMLRRGALTYMDLFTEYQYTKTTDWVYEREWRVVAFALPGESGKVSYWPFRPRELTGVYLGPNCSEEDQASIMALLKKGLEHVQVCRARRAGAAGRFSFEPVPRLS
jgi:DUF2971 family protein